MAKVPNRKTVTLMGPTLKALKDRIDATLGEGHSEKISIGNLGVLLTQWATVNMPQSLFHECCLNAKQVHDWMYKEPSNLLRTAPIVSTNVETSNGWAHILKQEGT